MTFIKDLYQKPVFHLTEIKRISKVRPVRKRTKKLLELRDALQKSGRLFEAVFRDYLKAVRFECSPETKQLNRHET